VHVQKQGISCETWKPSIVKLLNKASRWFNFLLDFSCVSCRSLGTERTSTVKMSQRVNMNLNMGESVLV
jgi:hypothetical protein